MLSRLWWTIQSTRLTSMTGSTLYFEEPHLTHLLLSLVRHSAISIRTHTHTILLSSDAVPHSLKHAVFPEIRIHCGLTLERLSAL